MQANVEFCTANLSLLAGFNIIKDIMLFLALCRAGHTLSLNPKPAQVTVGSVS